jgi:hypothetical protein
VIVAPFLDFTGAFWSERGKQAVRSLVTEHLPPAVDRERVFLVGLSNGAIGATAILQDPALARHFRGFILVSGSGQVRPSRLSADVLMIIGSEDERFPLAYNEGVAQALRESGAQVETSILSADHFVGWPSDELAGAASSTSGFSARSWIALAVVALIGLAWLLLPGPRLALAFTLAARFSPSASGRKRSDQSPAVTLRSSASRRSGVRPSSDDTRRRARP